MTSSLGGWLPFEQSSFVYRVGPPVELPDSAESRSGKFNFHLLLSSCLPCPIFTLRVRRRRRRVGNSATFNTPHIFILLFVLRGQSIDIFFTTDP